MANLMTTRFRWIQFWFSEILIPAAGSLGLVAGWCVIQYLSTGELFSAEFAGICFLVVWLQIVLLMSRGPVLKFQIWRRLRSLPREERTIDEAKSMFRAGSEGGYWRLPD